MDDVVDEERVAIEESKSMPKWLVQTLRDSKLATPLPHRTRGGSHHASTSFVDHSFIAETCNEEEPVSFEEAQESDHWMHAMQDEYDSILKNDTWDLAELPYGKKAIGTKWVYKLKRKADSSVDRYKARLVAKRYA